MLASIEIFDIQKKHALSVTKINKKNRQKLITEIEKFDGIPYVLNGKISSARNDFDELAICGFVDDKVIILVDQPAIEEYAEMCKKIIFSTDVFSKIFSLECGLKIKESREESNAEKKNARGAGRKPKAAPGSKLADEILSLRAKGETIRSIAVICKVSLMTVQKVLKEKTSV